MKRLNRFALPLALVAAWFGPITHAQAGGCHIVSAAPYVAPSYATPSYTYAGIPVLSVYLPNGYPPALSLFSFGTPYAYPVTAAAPAAPAAATATATIKAESSACQDVKDKVAALERDNAEMKAALKQLLEPIKPAAKAAPQEQAAPQAKAEPALADGLAIYQADCAKCHEASVSQAKGKGHSLSLKGALSMDSDMKRTAIKDLMSGAMPKGGNMSDERRAALIMYLASN